MITLPEAVDAILVAQKESGKPLAVILAGHNGSGKTTMWREHLADKFQIPLVNADRMMMSILPEIDGHGHIPEWATTLRDYNQSWMHVAQKGVELFVAQAMAHNVPFAMETVFSHWKELDNGKIESKIDRIEQMQKAKYFVLLFFVGLSNDQLSIARVCTRVAEGGHNVDIKKLISRFPRTQKAIRLASSVADVAILTDNSREMKDAFTICRIQMGDKEIYDRRNTRGKKPPAILDWLNIVSPR